MCRANRLPTCKGHGKGAGGDEQLEKDNDSGLKDPINLVFKPNPIVNEAIKLQLQKDNQSVLDLDLEDRLFSVDNNDESGTLIITGKKNLSPQDLKDFQELLDAIKTEFNTFKEELEKQGISIAKHFTATSKNNELTIHIPSPKHYDDFIVSLVDKNLLQTKDMTPQQNNVFNKTPFATKPHPAMSENVATDMSKTIKTSNIAKNENKPNELQSKKENTSPSPFSTTMKPY